MTEWQNKIPRYHVRCMPGAKSTEQQVMTMVKQQQECILRSSAVSEWFRVAFGGVWKAQNLKSRLKNSTLQCFSFFNFKKYNMVRQFLWVRQG